MKQGAILFALALAPLALGLGVGGSARSGLERAPLAQAEGCTYDGQNVEVGGTICIEGREYRCTAEGLISTGSDC